MAALSLPAAALSLPAVALSLPWWQTATYFSRFAARVRGNCSDSQSNQGRRKEGAKEKDQLGGKILLSHHEIKRSQAILSRFFINIKSSFY